MPVFYELEEIFDSLIDDLHYCDELIDQTDDFYYIGMKAGINKAINRLPETFLTRMKKAGKYAGN